MTTYFYLKSKKEKFQAVYLRLSAGMVIRGGKKIPDRTTFATNIKCNTSEWDAKRQEIIGKSISAKQRNNDLLDLRMKFEQEAPRTLGANATTAEVVEYCHQPVKERIQDTLLDVVNEMHSLANSLNLKSKKGTKLKESTQKSIKSRLVYLQTYIKETKDVNLIAKEFSSNKSIDSKQEIKLFWYKWMEVFRERLTEDYLDNTAAATMAIFKRVLKYAEDKYFINLHPVKEMAYETWDNFDVVEIPQELFQYIVGNWQSIRNSIETDEERNAFDFILYGGTVGQRKGDILSLGKSNFMRRGKDFVVRLTTGKTTTPIQLVLPNYLDHIINENIMKHGKPFILADTATLYTRIRAVLKDIPGFDFMTTLYRSKGGEKVEYKNDYFYNIVTAHTLRRTAATNMIQSGLEPHIVKAIGGWSADSQVFEKRYLAYNKDYANRSVTKYYESLESYQAILKVAT
jgi:integrase